MSNGNPLVILGGLDATADIRIAAANHEGGLSCRTGNTRVHEKHSMYVSRARVHVHNGGWSKLTATLSSDDCVSPTGPLEL